MIDNSWLEHQIHTFKIWGTHLTLLESILRAESIIKKFFQKFLFTTESKRM